jgi:hypothetical protein
MYTQRDLRKYRAPELHTKSSAADNVACATLLFDSITSTPDPKQ